MLTLFRHTSVRYSIPTISHSYLLREKSRILIGGVQMSTATPAEQTTTTPASTDAPPLVMQIVVRRDLMDVRTFRTLLRNFSSLLMYFFPGGGLGRWTLDGAGSSRHCRSKQFGLRLWHSSTWDRTIFRCSMRHERSQKHRLIWMT